MTCFKVFYTRKGKLDGAPVKECDVFYESACLLDLLWSKPDTTQHQVDRLWDRLFNDCREWQANMSGHDKQMVASTVFQIVRATLAQHYDSHYCEDICNMLNNTIERELKCIDLEEQKVFLQHLVEQSPALSEWINNYDDSDEWLSDEIADVIADKGCGEHTMIKIRKPKASKRTNMGEKRLSNKPKTLKYFTHGNNGILRKQRKRVDIVYNKWIEWGWIDDLTATDDFDAFFEGEPRHCNITWKAITTVLTLLLQELLEQPYIAKQKRQSPSSMVREQFGLTPNFDKNRLADDDEFRIEVTVFLLNINNPLPLRKGGEDDDYETTDAALQAVLSGQLRSTKGI